MSHNTHEGIRNLSPVSSISLALLFFYFIINSKKKKRNLLKVRIGEGNFKREEMKLRIYYIKG